MKTLKHLFIGFIIGLILFVGLIVLTGCDETKAYNSRFEKIYEEALFKVVYDKQTKVMYAVSSGYYNQGTVTVLVDAEGKPLLWKGE